MRIARAGRGFKVPQDVQLGVDAADRVGDHRVAKVRQLAVLDLRRQVRGEFGPAGDALEVSRRQHGRPAAGGADLQIAFGADRLLREQHPHHQIDQVCADVGQPLALDRAVEEPRRTPQWRPGDGLAQVMHALHDDGRLGVAAGDDGAEHVAVVDQLLLQDGRDLEAFGHDVVGHQPLALGTVQHCLQAR